MQKILIQPAKIIIFTLILTSCAKRVPLCPAASCTTESRPSARSSASGNAGSTSKINKKPLVSQRQVSYQSINNRSDLKKEQRMREKNTSYWTKQDRQATKAEDKRAKKEEKEHQKYMKNERKRHLKWQDADVRKRLKKNEKIAQKTMRKNAK
jgi:hypothetical protein